MDIKLNKIICRNSELKKAMKDGKDVYAVMASNIFKVPYEDCLDPSPNDIVEGKMPKEKQLARKRRQVAKNIIISAYVGDLYYLDLALNLFLEIKEEE